MTTPENKALEALALEAESIQSEQQDQTGAPGQDQGQDQPQALTNAQVLGGAIAAARSVFCMVTKLESPARILDDATAQRLGAAWGPVLDKHGINLGDTMGAYALEFTAAIVTFEVVMQLRAAVGAEIAAKEAARQQAEAPKEEPHTVENGAGI